MSIIKIEPFCIAGISIRTTNENGASSKDIPALWNRFLSEKIIEQIPGKICNDIYAVYTDYEKDFTKPYTTILGCSVENADQLPAGFASTIIPGGQYNLFTAKGNLQEGIVFNVWTKIWSLAIKRTYTADFEVYGAKAQNPANAEVDIFVAIE